MQDAYVSETGTGIGDWKLIGYKMNSTNNFQYFEGSIENGDQTGASVLLSDGNATYSTVVSSTDCDVLNASFGKLATGTATVN